MGIVDLVKLVEPPEWNQELLRSDIPESLTYLSHLSFMQEWAQFSHTYGTGYFDDDTVCIEVFNLYDEEFSSQYQRILESLQIIVSTDLEYQISSSFFHQYQHCTLLGKPEGFLPFGIDNNNNYLCYHYSLDELEGLVIALSTSRNNYTTYRMGLFDFLIQVFTKALKCPMWDWDEFSADGVSFRRF